MATARERPPEEAADDTSFARGLRLLLAVADRGEARVDELAVALDMPLSTVYRYVRTLADFGFVDRRDGRIALGPRLLIGSGSTVTSERLRRHAGGILQRLSTHTGETAVVMRRVGASAVLLDQVPAPRRLKVTLEPDAHMALHWGAPSRVLLAYAPDSLIEEVLGQRRSEAGDAAGDELAAELAAIAEAGIATSHDQPTGAVAVAVPILQSDGIVGTLAVLGPASRCDDEWLEATRRALPRAARSISSALAKASRSPALID